MASAKTSATTSTTTTTRNSLSSLLISDIKNFLLNYKEEIIKNRRNKSASSNVTTSMSGSSGFSSSATQISSTLNSFINLSQADPTTINALSTGCVVLRKRNSNRKRLQSPLDGVPLANYRLNKKDVQPEVFDWICHFLWLKNCPIELATIVAHNISKSIRIAMDETIKNGNDNNHYQEQNPEDNIKVNQFDDEILNLKNISDESKDKIENDDNHNNNNGHLLPDPLMNILDPSNQQLTQPESPAINTELANDPQQQQQSLETISSHDVARQSREMVDEYLDELGSNPDQAVSMVNDYLDTTTSKDNQEINADNGNDLDCTDGKSNGSITPIRKTPSPVFTSSIHAMKNRRASMEDRHVIIHNLNKALDLNLPKSYSYYAIFDGHAGIDAASFSTAHLHHYLVESVAFQEGRMEDAFREAFRKTDELYIKRIKDDGKMKPSGTTALCALIEDNKHVYLAWAGDSQAVLVRNGCHEDIMLPHKPDLESERIRIRDQGGFVIYLDTWRVNGVLSVTRAIGDPEHKAFIISDPSFSEFDIDSTLDFLVLGCDGLFDHLTGQDITSHVFEYLCKNENNDPEKVIQGVSEYLSQMAVQEGSNDNITSIVIFFKPFEKLVATGYPATQDLEEKQQDETLNPDLSSTQALPTTNGGHFPYTDFAELPIGTAFKLTQEEIVDLPPEPDNKQLEIQNEIPIESSEDIPVVESSEDIPVEEKVIDEQAVPEPSAPIDETKIDGIEETSSVPMQVQPSTDEIDKIQADDPIALASNALEDLKEPEMVCEVVDDDDSSDDGNDFDFVRTSDLTPEPQPVSQSEISTEEIKEELKPQEKEEQTSEISVEKEPSIEESSFENNNLNNNQDLFVEQQVEEVKDLIPEGAIQSTVIANEANDTAPIEDIAIVSTEPEIQDPLKTETASANETIETIFKPEQVDEPVGMEHLQEQEEKYDLNDKIIDLPICDQQEKQPEEEGQSQNQMVHMNDMAMDFPPTTQQQPDILSDLIQPQQESQSTEPEMANINDFLPQEQYQQIFQDEINEKPDRIENGNMERIFINDQSPVESLMPTIETRNDNDQPNMISMLIHDDTNQLDSVFPNPVIQDQLNKSNLVMDDQLIKEPLVDDSSNNILDAPNDQNLINPDPSPQENDSLNGIKADNLNFDDINKQFDNSNLENNSSIDNYDDLIPKSVSNPFDATFDIKPNDNTLNDPKNDVFNLTNTTDSGLVDASNDHIDQSSFDIANSSPQISSNDTFEPKLILNGADIDNANIDKLIPETDLLEPDPVSTTQAQPDLSEINDPLIVDEPISNVKSVNESEEIHPEPDPLIPNAEDIVKEETAKLEEKEKEIPEAKVKEVKPGTPAKKVTNLIKKTAIAGATAAAVAGAASKAISKVPSKTAKVGVTKPSATAAASKVSTTKPKTSTTSLLSKTTAPKPAPSKPATSTVPSRPSVTSKLAPKTTTTSGAAAKPTSAKTASSTSTSRLPSTSKLTSRPATASGTTSTKTTNSTSRPTSAVASKLTSKPATSGTTASKVTDVKKPVASSRLGISKPAPKTTTNGVVSKLTPKTTTASASRLTATKATTPKSPSPLTAKKTPTTRTTTTAKSPLGLKPSAGSGTKTAVPKVSGIANGKVNGSIASKPTAVSSDTTKPAPATGTPTLGSKRTNLIQVENSLKQELAAAEAAAAAAAAQAAAQAAIGNNGNL